MTPLENTSRRLAILLVAPEVSRHDGLAVIGHAEPQISDSESTDYAELLSAGNYRFDIVTPEQIDRQLLVHNGSLNYSTIIVAVPLSRLTPATLSLIHELSYSAGVSLIAGYDHPDERSAALFGIERFAGTRTLPSSKARIVAWPHKPGTENCVADYGVRSGFAGVRRRGLRKLSWKQTFIKGLGLARNLRMPYVAALPVPGAKVLLTTMDGEPLAWSHQFGNATNYYFALHGDLFLDKFNEIHRLVRSAIETNSGHGMASVDLDRTMVIRLDDPGASKADYQIDGQLMNENEWLELGHALKAKKIPLSVMYTPGWVDDGDAQAGSLFVDERPVANRLAGDVHDSPRVRYVFADSGKGEHDHASEFRGIEALAAEGLVDVHSHGLTHLVPDYEAWAAADDRRTDARWYAEFFNTKTDRPVDADAQRHALVSSKRAIENLFNAAVATITPAGHKHDSTCDILAHHAGYKLFSADYTGIDKKGILFRNWKIPSVFVFFKDPSSSVAKAGYPVIGVVHDYEIKGKVDHLCRIIDRWAEAGVKRFISMNDLAASLCCSVDARYCKEESSLSIDITLPAVVSSEGSAMPARDPEIAVKVAFPVRASCDAAAIDAKGATVVSMEQSEHRLNLLIRIVDGGPSRIVIPLLACGEELNSQLKRAAAAAPASFPDRNESSIE